jgi:hypothetical protein
MDARSRRISQGSPEQDRGKMNEFAAWRVEAVEATCRVLAREGHYLQAEQQLRNWMSLHAERAELLDLLARICVQQGQLEEAKRSWWAAERIDPGNARRRAALRKLSDLESRGGRLPLTLPSSRVVVLALVAIIVALVVFILFSHKRAHHGRVHQAPGAAASQKGSPYQTAPVEVKPSASTSMQPSPAATHGS